MLQCVHYNNICQVCKNTFTHFFVAEQYGVIKCLFQMFNMCFCMCRIINHSKKMSLTGKPYQGSFSRDDITCMQKAYGTFDTTSQHNTCFYPYLCLQNNCVISAKTKSRTTKRNNSCLSYIDTEGKLQRGICQKLFCFKDQPQQQFCLVNRFTLSSSQPCKDIVTNAQLLNHLVVCEPR